MAKITLRKILLVTSIITLLVSSITLTPVYAVMQSVNPASYTTTFKSTDSSLDDFCNANVNGTKMTINFGTILPTYEFRLAFYRVKPTKEVVDLGIRVPAETIGYGYNGNAKNGFSHTLDFSETPLSDGDYFLYISRIPFPGYSYELTPLTGALYRNLPFTVKKNKAYINYYSDVLSENNRIENIGAEYSSSWYLDQYLDDIRFVLRIPTTETYEDMTPEKVKFIQNLSAQITDGATDDISKLLKIYEYVAGNFYYDTVAFQTHSYQYANPYNNLYRHVNRVSGPNSDEYGRVATTCQGFSAMFLALARAQNIPTRFVYGHHATSPNNNWSTEENISVRDHWWVESYVNGKWIFVDPTTGTNNRWNKNTGVWQYYGLTNYTFFNPSEQQISVAHIYQNIYPDKRYGYLVDDSHEVEYLSRFLESISSNEKNGSIMNSSYSLYDKKTWGDGYKTHFMGNGYGNTTQIQWNYKDFRSTFDFSGFSKLKLFSMHNNMLTAGTLANCPSLENVYLQNNKLSNADLSGCQSLKTVNIKNNPLKTAAIYANGKNVSVTAEDNGTFSMYYDKSSKLPLTLYFSANIGYKVQGLYNGNGKKLTSRTYYSMNPGYQNYKVKFALNPDSYKYYLYPGRDEYPYLSYNKAVQKRLSALGYYQGNISGIYSNELKEAVQDFQAVNGTPITGKIGKDTWSAIFNSKAIARPSDESLTAISTIRNTSLSINANAAKKRITLNWAIKTSPDNIDDTENSIVPKGYQIWRSNKKASGYKRIMNTTGSKFTNYSGLIPGRTYYYKVRGYRAIDGKTYYSKWSYIAVKLPKSTTVKKQ